MTTLLNGDKNTLSYKVMGCAYEVYNTLGPRFLESVYERALMQELHDNGIKAQDQVPVDLTYKGEKLGLDLRLDILVEDKLILELKSVETLMPVHKKQLFTYLKLTGKQMGLLINFNEYDISKGIKRILNGEVTDPTL